MPKKNTLQARFILTLILTFSWLAFPDQSHAACPAALNKSKVTVGVSDTCSVPAANTYRIDIATGENSVATGNAIEVSGGSLTVNNTGTLRSGGTLTFTGGTMSIQSGGAVSLGPSWISDADADNWATGFTEASYLYNSTASGRRRLGLMSSTGTPDCNDAAFSLTNTCYAYSQGTYWSYGYSQSTYWSYGYGQSAYWRYAYGQSAYWRYAYGQGGYWRYAYGQGGYWRYAYGQSSYGWDSCFLAGTKVLMADGGYKNIEEIMAGDRVMSLDMESGARETDTVVKLLVHDNVPDGHLLVNGNLKVTPNHRVWSPNKNAWVRIGYLSAGDELLDSSGNNVKISSLEWIDGTNTVFNLTLDNNHNYFTEDYLVHNWK
jgi:hypothetical protein